MHSNIGKPDKKTSQEKTIAETVWRVLLERCAATPERDWHKVSRITMVSFKDIKAAIKEAMKEN